MSEQGQGAVAQSAAAAHALREMAKALELAVPNRKV